MVYKVSPRAGGGLTLLPRELTPLQQNFRLLEMLLLSRILRKFTGTFRIIYSEMRKEISHITHAKSLHAYLRKQSTSRKSIKGIHGAIQWKTL